MKIGSIQLTKLIHTLSLRCITQANYFLNFTNTIVYNLIFLKYIPSTTLALKLHVLCLWDINERSNGVWISEDWIMFVIILVMPAWNHINIKQFYFHRIHKFLTFKTLIVFSSIISGLRIFELNYVQRYLTKFWYTNKTNVASSFI